MFDRVQRAPRAALGRPDASDHTGPDSPSVRSIIALKTQDLLVHTGRVRCGDRTRPVAASGQVQRAPRAALGRPYTSSHTGLDALSVRSIIALKTQDLLVHIERVRSLSAIQHWAISL